MDEQDEVPSSRAAVVTSGVVTNIILMPIPGDEVTPLTIEGSDIVFLTDDSPVTFGWLWDPEQSEFTPPPDE